LNRYQVTLMPQAQNDLDSFSGKLLSRFEEALMGLYDEPQPSNSKKLSGSSALWRIRVGDYRVLYEIVEAEKKIKIYKIAHRKEAYR
jgi:mRNA interferase RelE/StbE